MKRVWSLIFGVCIFFGGTASALGAEPVFSAIKTGETDFATREYISIYNNSDTPIDVTNWCVYYVSASDVTKTKLTCFEPPDSQTTFILAPFGYLNLATTEFVDSITDFIPDFVFNSGISSVGGHIKLLDPDQNEIDKIGWGSAINPEGTATSTHSSGNFLIRKLITDTKYLQDTNNNFNDFDDSPLILIPVSGLEEQVASIEMCPNIEGDQTQIPDDYFADANGDCMQDQCDNLDGLQVEIPIGYESLDGENCTQNLLLLESSILTITELLPNVDGSDTGNEYIEIYNPNNDPVDLKGYKLDLGPAYTKTYIFEPQILNPLSYIIFNDSLTKLVLSNSTSISVRLTAPNGDVVSETDPYENPKEDEAWALIGGDWQYTNRPTPAAANLPSSVEVVSASTSGDTELTPCAPGKERNPETNRCRNIVTTDDLVPCKEGQERNPDTNRCRNIVTASATLQPCAEGQERNPDTNRCRKIDTAVAGVATSDVKDVPSKINSPKHWLIYGSIAVAVLGYGAYEWRSEIGKFFSKLKK